MTGFLQDLNLKDLENSGIRLSQLLILKRQLALADADKNLQANLNRLIVEYCYRGIIDSSFTTIKEEEI